MRRVAVVGGTGWVGRLVVEALEANGDEPVVLARSTGVDLLSGAGLDQALTGTDAVVDVSNIATTSGRRATRFFEQATSHLVSAAERVAAPHLVVLSVVGVDRVPLGYYAAKLRQEQVALAGTVPTTVLRATQFHEFAAQMLAARGPVVVTPKMLTQPVAAREVAQHLSALAAGIPVHGFAPELAGPGRETMQDMVRRLARARGDRRPVLAVRLPRSGAGMVSGALLPTSDGPRAETSYDAWLATPDAWARP